MVLYTPAKRPCPLVQGQLSQAEYLGLPNLKGFNPALSCTPPALKIHFSSSSSSFPSTAQRPTKVPASPIYTGQREGERTPCSGRWPWLPTTQCRGGKCQGHLSCSQGQGPGQVAFVSYTLSLRNTRESQFGTRSLLPGLWNPRTVGGPT